MAKPAWPSSLSNILFLITIVIPIAISIFILYNQPEGFDPVPIVEYSFEQSIVVPNKKLQILAESERIGDGLLQGPEDLAYDAENGYLYTGCYDGWIRRVRLAEEGKEPSLNPNLNPNPNPNLKVEDWVHVGGRPLGLALSPDKSIVVADSAKGLLLVKEDKTTSLLTNEAEGLKFALTDGVDVKSNGMIYFTDASYKYNLDANFVDILSGRPYGRLMSFDPSTNETVVLVRDLYFANGVSLSPDQKSLIFCETVIRKCKRYHIEGDMKGTVENFIDNLPGFPDNIRYDGEGHYWIALAAGRSLAWDLLMKYPFLRKMWFAMEKFVTIPLLSRNSGVMSVTLDGKPIALYSDPNLYAVTGGLKIGKHLYYGSLIKPYISRIVL